MLTNDVLLVEGRNADCIMERANRIAVNDVTLVDRSWLCNTVDV